MKLKEEQQYEIRERVGELITDFMKEHKLKIPEDMSFGMTNDYEKISVFIEDFIIFCNEWGKVKLK